MTPDELLDAIEELRPARAALVELERQLVELERKLERFVRGRS